MRVGEGGLERLAESTDAGQAAAQRPLPVAIHRGSAIGQQRQGRQLTGQLGRIRAGDAGPITREIDMVRPDGATVPVALRQPLAVEGIETQPATRELGQLTLGTEAPSEGQRIADDGIAALGRVIGEAGDALLAIDLQRADVIHDRDSARLEPSQVPESLGEGGGRAHKAGDGLELRGPRRGIEHRRDLAAGLRILIGDEVEQRPAAEKGDTLADRAALIFERDLGAAQAIDAGLGPAGQGKDPVGGAGRQDQRVPIQAEAAMVRIAIAMDASRLDLPDQRFGMMLERRLMAVEVAMQPLGLAGLEAIERPGVAAKFAQRRRPPVDLAAIARRFVEDHGLEPIAGQGQGGARARRTSADNDDAPPGHEFPIRSRRVSRTSV